MNGKPLAQFWGRSYRSVAARGGPEDESDHL